MGAKENKETSIKIRCFLASELMQLLQPKIFGNQLLVTKEISKKTAGIKIISSLDPNKLMFLVNYRYILLFIFLENIFFV